MCFVYEHVIIFRNADPIFVLASQLRASEHKSTTKKMLAQLGSCSAIHCSQPHSERKWGKDRRIKKQQLLSLPTRVMPSRRVKSSAQRTVRISKQPLTSFGPIPKGIENIYNCSGQGFKLQSVMDRPLQENSAVVASWDMLTGFQGMSWRGFECGQLLNEMDRNSYLGRANGNGTFWWDKIDSRTWLEALQAYLLHMSTGGMNVTEENSCASAASECRFTASNLTGASASSTGFCLTGDDVVGCSMSGQNTGEFTEASKESPSVDVSSVPVSADLQQQLDSGEAQNCECDSSEKQLTDSKDAVQKTSKLELPMKCSDKWLSGTPVKNPSNGNDTCESELCKGIGEDEQAMKLCTLSDLKVMHNVLFDSKSQSSNSATRDVCKESVCLAATAVLPAECKSLNDATLESSVTDVNANAKSLMANADLVRFMHSYCQQEMGAKREPCSSRKPTDTSSLSRSPSSSRIPVSFVDFIQEIVCSKKDAEQIRVDLGTGKIRTNQVNGNSEMLTGVRSFHLEGRCSDTLRCLHGCIAHREQCCASLNFASKRDGNCNDLSTVVSRESYQDVVGRSSCLTQSPENCCDMSSRSVVATNSDVKEKKRKHDVISTPGWFGKGISLRKRKRKIVK